MVSVLHTATLELLRDTTIGLLKHSDTARLLQLLSDPQHGCGCQRKRTAHSAMLHQATLSALSQVVATGMLSRNVRWGSSEGSRAVLVACQCLEGLVRCVDTAPAATPPGGRGRAGSSGRSALDAGRPALFAEPYWRSQLDVFTNGLESELAKLMSTGELVG